MNPIVFSTEQKRAFDLVTQRSNIFITGAAGTGKSALLKHIIASIECNVTASTGAAAALIGGSTLHSFMSIGLGQGSVSELLKKMYTPARRKIQACKCLIIDEISMIDSILFEKIDSICRTIRGRQLLPFGGMQLIVAGDFLQIPPVTKNKALFLTDAWKKAIPETVLLKQVFRQSSEEKDFLALLSRVRHMENGDGMDSKTEAQLIALERPLQPVHGIQPTRLFARNFKVDEINLMELAKLNGKVSEYKCIDSGPDKHMAKHMMAPELVSLKPGAQVMFLVNLPAANLVNGSRGVVTQIDKMTGIPWVKFANGAEVCVGRHIWVIEKEKKIVFSRSQIPLRLAWAISIHKSQGMSINLLEVDLNGIFEDSQAYVALSRATSMNTLRVINYDRHYFRCSKTVLEYYANLEEG